MAPVCRNTVPLSRFQSNPSGENELVRGFIYVLQKEKEKTVYSNKVVCSTSEPPDALTYGSHRENILIHRIKSLHQTSF